jgi:hypothetical protein
MIVNKAWRHYQPLGIDGTGSHAIQLANGNNFAMTYGHITHKSWHARAVNNAPIFDWQIICHTVFSSLATPAQVLLW